MQAFPAATTSGLLSSNTQVSALAAYVSSVQLAAGSTSATLVVYDGTSTSGKVIVNIIAAAGTSQVAQLNIPVAANLGIYATVSGTGASAVVHYVIGA